MNEPKTYNNLLAIDSSGSILRVGVACGDIVTEETSNDRFRHAEFIFNLIEKTIKESSVKKSDLEGLVVSTGPGSFTGLRVGLAAAKGLALALDLPIIGVTVFEELSKPLNGVCGPTTILIPSRRGEYYMYESSNAAFDAKTIRIIKSAELASLPQDQQVYLTEPNISDPQLKAMNHLTSDDFAVTTGLYIKAGREKLLEFGGDDIDRLVPLYIQTFPVRPRK